MAGQLKVGGNIIASHSGVEGAGTVSINTSSINTSSINTSSINANSISVATNEVLDSNLNLKNISTGSIETLGLNRLNMSSEYAGTMSGSGGYLFNLFDVVSDRTSGLIIVSASENTVNRYTVMYHYGVVYWENNSTYYGNFGQVYAHGYGNSYGRPYIYFTGQASTPTTQSVSSTNKSALDIYIRNGSGAAGFAYRINFVFNHNAA